jgi:hypothetical protein
MQESNRDARELEAIANLQHLINLKLLHPPRAREQIERWQALLAETVNLLRLLSTSSNIPSNTSEAAAAVVAAHGVAPAAAAATAQAKKPQGLLHGVPVEDRERREVWRALSGHVHRMLKLLNKEVCNPPSVCKHAHAQTPEGQTQVFFPITVLMASMLFVWMLQKSISGTPSQGR